MKKNWKSKKLSEVCAKITDGTHQTPTYFNEGVIFLSSKNVTSGKIDWDNIKYIDEKQHLEMHKRVAPQINDILLAKNGTTGVAAMVDRNLTFDIYVSLALLRPLDGLFPPYLLHFVNSPIAKKQFNKRLKGIGVPNLHLEEIREVEIPFPPLPEQHRIVAILDEAFEAIAIAKANAEQNLKNAKELFESYLQNVFEKKSELGFAGLKDDKINADTEFLKSTNPKNHNSDIGKGWEEKRLGEIAKVIGGYSFKSGDFEKQGKYQVLRMGNVRPGIIRTDESPVFIDKLDDNVLKKALLLPNDVIITQTGTNKKRDYGFTVIIDKDNYLLNQRISTIRFSINYLPKFFLYYSWTNSFKDQYFKNETGTVGQGNVGIGAITNAIVPYPSLKEQQSIVQKLDTLSAETKKLEAIYQKKLVDLEELKKSVLQKAFNGEL